MRTRTERSLVALFGALSAILILSSCSDTPEEPPEGVSICHVTGSSGAIVFVPRSQLATHLADGDYLTYLSVNHDASQADDAEHFHRILDALDAARTGRLARNETATAACRITITVASGVYQASDVDSSDTSVEWLPLVVDVPDITLHGALEMALDGNGRATGEGTSSLATTISPTAPLQGPDEIIVADGHPGGSAGNGLTVEGFVFQSGWGPDEGSSGFGIISMRVSGLTVRGNRWEHGFGFALDLRATSAAIIQNQISGIGSCDMCLAGPGNYQITDNLLPAGTGKGIGIGRVAAFGAPHVEPYDVPPEVEVSADISNNEIRDHLNLPFGAAIRLFTAAPPGVVGSGHFTVHDNLLVNNLFAMEIDAGFPSPTSTGDVDATLGGNVIQQSCQADLLVSFTRLLPDPESIYLVNSPYTLDLGGDVDWDNVWYSHPDGFGNTLVVDGNTIANGDRAFYDPDTCPGQAGS